MCKFELVLVHASQGQAIIITFLPAKKKRGKQKTEKEAETLTELGLGLNGT